jgi:hypothetical protein
LDCQRSDPKQASGGARRRHETPGGTIPFRWAASSRFGGRHHSVTTGDIISFWWAASPGISTPEKVPARKPGEGKLKAIGDAPGDYVRVKA